MRQISFFSLALLLFIGCKNLTRDIEITLTPSKPQLQVECYLRPGLPYLLSLNETNDYFNSNLANINSLKGAIITIEKNGAIDTLKEFVFNYKGRNLTVYANLKTVPNDTINAFRLNIKTADGRVAWAETRILPPAKIDSLRQLISPTDGKRSVTAVIKDKAATRDFYRMVTYKNSRDSLPDRTVRFTDFRVNGQDIISSTGYRFNAKDTLYWQLYHIDQAYYDFLQSSSAAASANGNPFAQPALLRSNINGGIGIFTGMNMTEKIIIIK